jgi:hypothetical protein
MSAIKGYFKALIHPVHGYKTYMQIKTTAGLTREQAVRATAKTLAQEVKTGKFWKTAAFSLALTAVSAMGAGVAVMHKFSKDESFYGEIFNPYLPEHRPIIEAKEPLLLQLQRVSIMGKISPKDLFSLVKRSHETIDDIRNNKYSLSSSEFIAFASIAQRLSVDFVENDKPEDQWLILALQIKIAEALSIAGPTDADRLSVFIKTVKHVSAQTLERLSTNPQALKLLNLEGNDDSGFVQAATNILLRDIVLTSSFYSHGATPAQLSELEELLDEKTALINHDKTDLFVSRLKESIKKGYWYKDGFLRAYQYYRDLSEAGTIEIDVENIRVIRQARSELLPDVPLFMDSCKFHGCPPSLLASVALYNRLIKAKLPTYSLKSFGMVAEASPDHHYSIFRNISKTVGKIPFLSDLSFQDRFIDFTSGIVLGVSGTVGLMQVRADNTVFPEEKSVRGDNLLRRFGIDGQEWSIRKLNAHLIFSDRYSIEAAAALWEIMRQDSLKVYKDGGGRGLPCLISQKEEWLTDDQNYPLAKTYGPDFYGELLDQPHPLNTSLPPIDPNISRPKMYLFNSRMYTNLRSLAALHRVILQSGLFRDSAAVFVGISTLDQLAAVNMLLSSSDEYLKKAAFKTLCAISRDVRHPMFMSGALHYIENSGNPFVCDR